MAIVNPHRSKALGTSMGVRDKTDRIDAAVLALYGQVHRPAPTRLRSRQAEELRELVRLRQSLHEARTGWCARLKEALGKTAKQLIKRQIERHDRDIERLEGQIDALIEEDAELRRQVAALEQIQGIGKVTARTITAELGDLRRFKRNELVAMAGLFPRRFESGRTVARQPRMVKGGGGRVRRALYMCAVSSMGKDGPWRAKIDHWLARGMSPMATIGALMRKMLLVARAVMLNGGHYEPRKIGAAA